MKKNEDYIGRKFGRLLIIGIGNHKRRTSGKKIAVVICKCDCGNEKEVQLQALQVGTTKSCGCYKMEINNLPPPKHGLSRHPLYANWFSMIDRCTNPKNEGYHRYGGRGISVCDEWASSFKKFIEWGMQNGYKKGLQLDRIDNNGNYSPENCRFVTVKENSKNRRNNLMYSYKGETKMLIDWAEQVGLKYTTLYMRVRSLGDFAMAIESEMGQRHYKSNL